MDIKLIDSFTPEAEKLIVKDIYLALNQDSTTKIPFWVYLIENPASPIPMPGKINLENHDYLHILLGCDRSPEDEAFVVGFTMGNDTRTKWHHIIIFKLFSYFIYPKPYNLNYRQLKIFDLGFMYGRKINFKQIHTINFAFYQNYTLGYLRKLFGIKPIDIALIRNFETKIAHKQQSESA